MINLWTIFLKLGGEKTHSQIWKHTTKLFDKSFELWSAGKYDEATPFVKSGIKYMQKHFDYFGINEQMLTDFDNFLQEKYKSKGADLAQVIWKAIDEYYKIVKPKISDGTALNLSMYIYLFYLGTFIDSWDAVLKPYRVKHYKAKAYIKKLKKITGSG